MEQKAQLKDEAEAKRLPKKDVIRRSKLKRQVEKEKL